MMESMPSNVKFCNSSPCHSPAMTSTAAIRKKCVKLLNLHVTFIIRYLLSILKNGINLVKCQISTFLLIKSVAFNIEFSDQKVDGVSLMFLTNFDSHDFINLT